jgi:hypothetical protein
LVGEGVLIDDVSIAIAVDIEGRKRKIVLDDIPTAVRTTIIVPVAICPELGKVLSS